VYSYLGHQGAASPPSACDLDETAVTLNVMSKSFGLGGLRIGWIATRNAKVRKAISAFKDYTTICNSAPSEFLAVLGLRSRDTILARNRAIIDSNMALLQTFFKEFEDRLQWIAPRHGPIAFPSLRDGSSANVFCAKLRTEVGVLALPGSVYGPSYSANFRIGFGRAKLPQALERVADYLRRGRAARTKV
jgi:aspartate/methionine/tyrosine aminotransferase